MKSWWQLRQESAEEGPTPTLLLVCISGCRKPGFLNPDFVIHFTLSAWPRDLCLQPPHTANIDQGQSYARHGARGLLRLSPQRQVLVLPVGTRPSPRMKIREGQVHEST